MSIQALLFFQPCTGVRNLGMWLISHSSTPCRGELVFFHRFSRTVTKKHLLVKLSVRLLRKQCRDKENRSCEFHIKKIQGRDKGVLLKGKTMTAPWNGMCISLTSLPTATGRLLDKGWVGQLFFPPPPSLTPPPHRSSNGKVTCCRDNAGFEMNSWLAEPALVWAAAD